MKRFFCALKHLLQATTDDLLWPPRVQRHSGILAESDSLLMVFTYLYKYFAYKNNDTSFVDRMTRNEWNESNRVTTAYTERNLH